MDHFNKKEQDFKNILSDLDLDLDLDKVWQDVEGQLTFKDDNRLPFFIRILSGLVLVSASFLFVGSFFVQSENLVAQQISESNNSTYTSQSLVTTTTTTSSSAIVSESTIEIDDQQFVAENELEVENTIVDALPLVSDYIPETNEVLVNVGHQIINSEETKAKAPQSLYSTRIIKNTKTSAARVATVLDPSKLPLRPIQGSLFPVIERTIAIDQISFVAPQIIIPVERMKWMPYYSLALGSDLSINGIEILDSDLRNKDNKANYESGLPGLSGSLLAGIENENGFKLYGGVSISQAVARYRDIDSSIETETTIGATSFRIDENGNQTTVEGPIDNNTITQYDVNWHRRHTSFDVLVGFGKRMNLGKGFHFDLSGGANFNVLTRSSGYVFQNDLETITKFTGNDNDYYRSSWGLGAHARMGIEKEISEVLSLGLYGVGTHYFNAINSETQLFNIKNSRIGLQFGITYRPIRESH